MCELNDAQGFFMVKKNLLQAKVSVTRLSKTRSLPAAGPGQRGRGRMEQTHQEAAERNGWGFVVVFYLGC